MMGVLVQMRPEKLNAAPRRLAVALGDAASPEIVMDLSRLLSRFGHSTPTGIDRVELAYALGLLCRVPDQLSFAAVHPTGIYTRLSKAGAVEFLNNVQDRWTRGGEDTKWHGWHRWAASAFIRPVWSKNNPNSRRVYLHLSPRSLERDARYRRILAREQAKLVCFVHDLIPTEHPHLSAISSVALFQRRLRTMLDLADGFLVNSQATAASLLAACIRSGRDVPIKVAPLGISALVGAAAAPNGKPYFLMLSTIEPRKNHLLMLQVWQRMLASMPRNKVPDLQIVGRRGWDVENVTALLDRAPALKGVVFEHGRVSDRDLATLLKGATALLAPSFIEGYGLPVAEALAAGIPVIASDIAAHREVGRGVPDFLDPLDGPGWLEAVLDYARPNSVRLQAQHRRLQGWVPPSWDSHFDYAVAFLNEITNKGHHV